MTWYYFIHPYPTTGGPLTTTLTWNGVSFFESAVLPLPDEAYACSVTPIEGCACCFYQIRVYCTEIGYPGAYIFIWPDSTGAAGTGPGHTCIDPPFTNPSGVACNLPMNQGLHPVSMTSGPYSITYGPNDTIGMASGMLTP